VKDENEVLAAHVSQGNMLNLRTSFPGFKQTREVGFILTSDGGALRAFYNRDSNGVFTPSATGSLCAMEGSRTLCIAAIHTREKLGEPRSPETGAQSR